MDLHVQKSLLTFTVQGCIFSCGQRAKCVHSGHRCIPSSLSLKMCELLIRVNGAGERLPVVDFGMIICVKDDGAEWGREEVKAPVDGGKFVRVKLIGVDKEKVGKYLEPEPDEFVPSQVSRKRKFRVLVDKLPIGMRSALRATGSYGTSWFTLRGYMENIQDKTVERGVVL